MGVDWDLCQDGRRAKAAMFVMYALWWGAKIRRRPYGLQVCGHRRWGPRRPGQSPQFLGQFCSRIEIKEAD